MKIYLITGIIFAVLDFCWLSLTVGRFYRPHLGALMRDEPAWVPAIAFYVIFTATLVFLVVAPAYARNDPSEALIRGAVFGLATYATYNLTNLATVRNWPEHLVFVDTAWGMLLAGLSAFFAVLIAQKF